VDGEKLAKIIPNLGLPGAIFKKLLLHKIFTPKKTMKVGKANIKIYLNNNMHKIGSKPNLLFHKKL
jgi:hypothetical protein